MGEIKRFTCEVGLVIADRSRTFYYQSYFYTYTTYLKWSVQIRNKLKSKEMLILITYSFAIKTTFATLFHASLESIEYY